MLVACLLAALALLSAASPPDGHCEKMDADIEGTSLVLTHSVRTTEKSGYKLGDFDKSSQSGYFSSKPNRYGGKKVFFSKNSCATVLYCLKNAYGPESDAQAWGPDPKASTRRTPLEILCKKRGIQKLPFCHAVNRPKKVLYPALGPRAHKLCQAQNIADQNEDGTKNEDCNEGCSKWMQPFMNQLALTLGSSSYELNLFLDFGSAGIKQCMPPIRDYDQGCVNETLRASVQEADIFVFFPHWYCGDSCAIEVEVASQVAETRAGSSRPLTLVELDWDDYYSVFHRFDSPPNPSCPDESRSTQYHANEDQWRAGGAAAVHILQRIQSKVTLVPHDDPKTRTKRKKRDDCYPAGQCVGFEKSGLCCSGHSSTLFDRPCLRDFGQGEVTPDICD